MLKFNVLSNETPGRVIEVKDDVNIIKYNILENYESSTQ